MAATAGLRRLVTVFEIPICPIVSGEFSYRVTSSGRFVCEGCDRRLRQSGRAKMTADASLAACASGRAMGDGIHGDPVASGSLLPPNGRGGNERR